MLEVVEHEQELVAPEISAEILFECLATRRAEPESLRGGRQDEVGILEWREADETTPSANASTSPVAVSIASRVLPVPPVPVNVASPDLGTPEQVCHLRISRSRPISGVGLRSASLACVVARLRSA